MKKVSFQTLGCKLNFAETSTIGRQFVEKGFKVVNSDESADIYVINTCTVTQRAESDCRQLIRRVLRKSPDAYIVVVGCYSQLHSEEIARIKGVDLILGSDEKFNLLEFAGDFKKNRVPKIILLPLEDSQKIYQAYSSEIGGRTRAYLKIQDGCDYTCSFCTIPRARGKSRSVPIDDVLNQVKRIVNEGRKEIVLTGVNVGDYGRKINTSLLELMQKLDKVDGLERIRISSLEPNLLSEKLINFILESKKFCKHFHIPLQSGSNTILKRMRRRYNTDSYKKIIEYINKSNPDTGIGLDVIAGFPGETDALFEETVSYLENLPFTCLHAFTYSERPGTPAVDYHGRVEPAVRYSRNERLRSLGLRKKLNFISRYLGQTLTVLFEDSNDGSYISGLTSNYIRISVKGDVSLVNMLQDVKITSINGETCIGIIEKK